MRSLRDSLLPSDFCRSDVAGICQASIAVLALFGTLWSVGLLF